MRRATPADGPPYYVFDRLDPAGVAAHAVFTRRGGVSAVPYDSLNVSSSIGDDPAAVEVNRARVLASTSRASMGRRRASRLMAADATSPVSTRW